MASSKKSRNAARKKRLKRKAECVSHDDLPELRQARALWAKNKMLESAAAFDEVLRRHPNNTLALNDASRAHGQLYDYPRAMKLLEHAVQIGANHGAALQMAGQSYRIIRRYDEAIDCFQQALRHSNQNAELHLELSILYERKNRLDDALQHCNARLAKLKDDPEAQFVKGRALRRKQRDDEAESLLLSVAKRADAHWLTRARAYADLAKLYDNQEKYTLAWEAALAGKSLAIPHADQAKQQRRNNVEPLKRLVDQLEASDVEDWFRETDESPNNVLLTGMPRSGTTLLGKLLHECPSITTADEFDIVPRFIYPILLSGQHPDHLTPHFLNDLQTENLELFQRTRHDLFRNALHDFDESEVLVDKNPSLLPLLAPYCRMFPNDKVLVALRDPRDILLSCMMTYLPLNGFSVDFLCVETAVDRISNDLGLWQQVRTLLPEEKWHTTRYEDLIQDQEKEVKTVLDFISPIAERETSVDSKPLTIYSPSYADVHEPIHHRSIGRWQNYADKLGNYLPRLERLVD